MDPILTEVKGLVGRSYAEFDCWELVRHAYRLRGVELDPNFFVEVHKEPWRTVSLNPRFPAEPWDVVGIRNHPLWILHVGLCLGRGEFLHSLENVGVVVCRLDRDPWARRIAGFSRHL